MTLTVLIREEIDAARVVRLTRRADGAYDCIWIDAEGQYGQGVCAGHDGAALVARQQRMREQLYDDALRACQGMD